jgi:hypothetical protein
MDRLRAPFFWLAGFVLLVALLIECASAFVLNAVHQAGFEASTPGLGIRYLPVLDGLLLYTVLLMGLGILLSRSVIGRVQGIVTLVIAFFGLLGAIVMVACGAGPADPDDHPAGRRAVRHDRLFRRLRRFPDGRGDRHPGPDPDLKIAFCILLLLAHERFLQNKGIVILSAGPSARPCCWRS